MEQPIPAQQPPVVLRSRYTFMRALLAAALFAVIGLTVTVVVLANDGDQTSGTGSAAPLGQLNYGRQFNPATGRPYAAPLPKREAQTPNTGSSGRVAGAPPEFTPLPARKLDGATDTPPPTAAPKEGRTDGR
jgi:hypothetical protein